MLSAYEAALKLLSIYRHEFLNCLQVVGGLTQLNKTERLLDYIREASEKIQQLGRLASCGDPRLALIIFESFYYNAEIIFLLEVHGTVIEVPVAVLQETEAILEQIRLALINLENCTLSLSIRAGEDTALKLQIFGLDDPDSFWPPLLGSMQGYSLPVDLNAREDKLTIYLDKMPTAEEK